MNCMMSPFAAWTFRNMTPLDTELKVFATSSWRTTQLGWRSKVHKMSWIIVSQPPLITIPNWCREKMLQKFQGIEDVKRGLWVDTMFPHYNGMNSIWRFGHG